MNKSQIRALILGCLLMVISCACSPMISERSTLQPIEQQQLQPGWHQIVGEGVSLSLPTTYEGGNPSRHLEDITKQIQAVNPSYEQRLQLLKQNAGAIALLAIDTSHPQADIFHNVSIITDKLPQKMTLKQYLETKTKQLNTTSEIKKQELVTISQYPAGVIIATFDTESQPIEQLFYIIKNDQKLWIVTYTTLKTEFEQFLPQFEQSIRTFQLTMDN